MKQGDPMPQTRQVYKGQWPKTTQVLCRLNSLFAYIDAIYPPRDLPPATRPPRGRPRLAIGLLCCVLAVPVTVAARAQSPEQTLLTAPAGLVEERIDALSLGGLTDLITGVGLSGTAIRTQSGTPGLRVDLPGGGTFVAALRACPDDPAPECSHLELFALFAADGPNSGAQALNLFNAQAAAVKAFAQEEGPLVLTRYVTLNHGIARGNVLGNIAGFQRSAERFRAFLQGPARLAPPTGPQIAVSGLHARGRAPEGLDPSYLTDTAQEDSLVNDPAADLFLVP